MNATPHRLVTKVARQQRIADILETHDIESQHDLRQVLARLGLDVTQATLSRDLDELGAVKVTGPGPHLVYRLPAEGASREDLETASASAARSRLERVMGELVGTVEHSGNIVVLRTPPGAAQYLASVLDHSALAEIMGTVAGDDTVLVVSRHPDGGAALANRLADMSGRRNRHHTQSQAKERR